MPITPAEIQKKTFSEAKRGYAPGEVDVFLEEIGKDVDAMLRKIADLKTRLTAAEAQNAELAGQLEAARAEAEAARNATQAYVPAPAPAPAAASKDAKPSVYTATEEQLSATLIIAQQTADRIVAEAKTNADFIRANAKNEADALISQANDVKKAQIKEAERLKASADEFRAEYLALIARFQQAATDNFAPAISSALSGSEAPEGVAPRSSAQTVLVEQSPYGAQIDTAGLVDDLD
jgi:cell division initiation protein